MKRLLKMLLFVGCLLLASCGSSTDKPMSGFVVGKRHTPAHTTRHYNPTTHHYTTHHHSESWVLWLADSTTVRRVNVDESTYQSTERGEHICLHDGKEND